MLLKEVERRAVGLKPMSMSQEPMDLIGEYELLDFHVPLSEFLYQIDGFVKGDIAIVVAVKSRAPASSSYQATP